MNRELVELALGANRVMTYAGYVLLAGTFTFWSLVWPEGRSDRRLVVLAVTGTGLLFLATIGGPGIEMLFGAKLPGDVLTRLSGAALLVRLGALAGIAFLLADLVDSAVVGWRRIFALAAVAVIAGTMVTQSNAIGGRWQGIKIIATGGHVLATATWLGGLVALAAVLIPRENLLELDRLIPRFSVVATFSVIILVATGTVHALAVAGGIGPLVSSRYGLVLLIKVAVFGLMLLLGNHGRHYAARLAFRRQHHPDEPLRTSSGVQGLAVVMGAELTIAFVILATTSILVMVAPHA
jgi:putative copper export protein